MFTLRFDMRSPQGGAPTPELYRTALDEGYRFLSFGDAMLVDRADPDDLDDEVAA